MLGAASAATSGTSRQSAEAGPQCPGSGVGVTAADCQAGMGQMVEMPPPEAPSSASPVAQPMPLSKQSFHTACPAAVPVGSAVPPTPVTSGWLAGSSTARPSFFVGVPSGKQPSEPSSPEAASMVWPWAAMTWKMSFSRPAAVDVSVASHTPQLLLTTWARSSAAIWFMVTSGPEPAPLVVLFGPWYTTTLAVGARAATSSMSKAASPLPEPVPGPPSTVTLVTAVDRP